MVPVLKFLYDDLTGLKQILLLHQFVIYSAWSQVILFFGLLTKRIQLSNLYLSGEN